MSGLWIKICGLTGAEPVASALEVQVDALGFVFTESPRRITPHLAVQLAAPARGRVRCVAVVCQPTQQQVDEIVTVFKPDVLQTDLADLAMLRLPRALEVLPVMRAGVIPPKNLPARLLFEGPASGTGVVSDWTRASEVARQTQLVLAGGLDSRNVSAAIRAVAPFGVDVSSGVEESLGIKSAAKIAQFVAAARAASKVA